MSEQQQDKAIASAHWRWMPSMTTTDDALVVAVNPDDGAITVVVFDGELMEARAQHRWSDDPGECPWYDSTDARPRFDAATLGCIEHVLLPKAWGGDKRRIMIEMSVSRARAGQSADDTDSSDGYHRCSVFVVDGRLWRREWYSVYFVDRIDALLECLDAAP